MVRQRQPVSGDGNLVAKHMAVASCNLPGYQGLPGCPGTATPLTYEPSLQSANNTAACGNANPPAGFNCDEYPFATTAQGGACASTCIVPSAANSSQGGAYRRSSPRIASCQAITFTLTLPTTEILLDAAPRYRREAAPRPLTMDWTACSPATATTRPAGIGAAETRPTRRCSRTGTAPGSSPTRS